MLINVFLIIIKINKHNNSYNLTQTLNNHLNKFIKLNLKLIITINL